MYVQSLNCNCNYAPKTFNQGRDSLRKFPSVECLLIREAYNEVNENNALITESCVVGSIIATLFRLDFALTNTNLDRNGQMFGSQFSTESIKSRESRRGFAER